MLLVGTIASLSGLHTARAISTIYIQSDGTISPTNAPIQRNGDVYTLTGNINSDADGIVIERNGTVLDGAGYTLQGTNTPSTNGIYGSGITGVTIRNINVKAFESGIVFDAYSTFNQIINSNVEDNDYGINCWAYSDNNSIIGNSITANNVVGIWIAGSSSINVSENNIMGNSQYGMSLESSSNSSIFNNNFINNPNQIDIYASTSFWDNGYPSGGNYWSDYNGVDIKCGPNQDHPGADGIGDAPYTLDSNNIDNYPLMNTWTPPSGHNVAVISAVSYKTVIGQGVSGNITVYGANEGVYTETFNVTVYANTTYIASRNVTLSSGTSTNVTLFWNAVGFAKGNYTISAYAWPVPGETSTADNNFTASWVVVSLVGDVYGPNGWPDGKVDIRDVHYVATYYGTTLSSLNWNPNADINNDGKVDIRDVHIAAMNYGQHYP